MSLQSVQQHDQKAFCDDGWEQSMKRTSENEVGVCDMMIFDRGW